jgi:hypothetical protein
VGLGVSSIFTSPEGASGFSATRGSDSLVLEEDPSALSGAVGGC